MVGEKGKEEERAERQKKQEKKKKQNDKKFGWLSKKKYDERNMVEKEEKFEKTRLGFEKKRGRWKKTRAMGRVGRHMAREGRSRGGRILPTLSQLHAKQVMKIIADS